MSIPFDILLEFLSYFRLPDRYRWSLVSSDFAIQTREWTQLGVACFQLHGATRASIQNLCQREFNASLAVQKQEAQLWSPQLQEPLTLFTPWCTLDHCRDNPSNISLYIRDAEFVQTVHRWAQSHHLQGPNTSIYAHHRCLVARIWKRTRKRFVTISKNQQGHVLRKTIHIVLAFHRKPRSRSLVRALIKFRIWKQQLQLFVQHLELLVRDA